MGVFMKSPVVKHSIIIAGHEASVSLEDAFWKRLKEIAEEREMTLSDLVAAMNSQRQQSDLSSALRLFVLNFYCTQTSGSRRGATELTGWCVRTALQPPKSISDLDATVQTSGSPIRIKARQPPCGWLHLSSITSRRLQFTKVRRSGRERQSNEFNSRSRSYGFGHVAAFSGGRGRS